jgi:hypothetical protein
VITLTIQSLYRVLTSTHAVKSQCIYQFILWCSDVPGSLNVFTIAVHGALINVSWLSYVFNVKGCCDYQPGAGR